ncbi:MAG: ABC transporter permease [Muribaculum sp.]|nr:ABC transporter permease [Muribaculum sp.]
MPRNKKIPFGSLGRAVGDGIAQLCGRPIYLLMMVAVPLFATFFFLDFMNEGLPLKSPSAIVDLDNTPVSRRVGRNLAASELIEVKYHPESYEEAMKLLKGGDIYGFFMIPRSFQRDAEAGRSTTITFYTNMAYYVPGSLSYKGFKTVAVTTSGAVVSTTLQSVGLHSETVNTILQPVVTDIHPLGNPWSNYSIYLSNSFLPCLLQLIIFQITAFSILQEVKRGTSVRWIQNAGGSVWTACMGKLIPQYLIFLAVGLAMQGMMYGFWKFPLNGSVWGMVIAMMLLVGASQAFALFVTCLIPNLRFSLSILSLTGILSFSIAGFSFPVEDMYPAVGIFSYLLPIRYYFLIYINVALNGYEMYYCHWEYIALILLLLPPTVLLRKLKRISLNPVYVP